MRHFKIIYSRPRFNITTKHLLWSKEVERTQNQSAKYGVMEPGAGGRPVCTELVRDQKIQTHPERGLATNIIIYVGTHQLAQLYLLSTSQTGDGYLCIVCVWFTFSCTLVPNSFVIIASFICMVHIVSLSASIKPENINIGFTNFKWIPVSVSLFVTRCQLGSWLSSDRSYLDPVYVTRLQPHFQ